MVKKVLILLLVVALMFSYFGVGVSATNYCPECGYVMDGSSLSCSGTYRNGNSNIGQTCTMDDLYMMPSCIIDASRNYWTARTYYHVNPLKPPCTDNRYGVHVEEYLHTGNIGIPFNCDIGMSNGEWEDVCPY